MSRRASRLWLVLSAIGVGACAGAAPSPRPTSAVAPSVPKSRPASAVLATNVPSMARAVTSFGAAAHGGALYTFGGYFGVPHAYSREGQSGELIRIDLERRAETVIAVDEGVQGAQLVSSPQGLVRVGGMRALNAKGEAERIVSLTDVSRFDEGTRTWQPLAPLPEARSSHALVFLDGELFVLGGWTLGGTRSSGTFATTTLVLDLEAGRYRTIAQPAQLRAAQAAVINGKVALIGGIDANGKTVQSVHLLDPKTGSWTAGPDIPTDAFGVAVASDGRALYASARDGVVYALRDGQSAWTKLAYLAFPRFFHQMVMLDDRTLAVVGGISGMHQGSRIAHIELVDTQSTAPRVMSWTLPSLSPAKNRQGVQVLGDKLWVFGGNRSLAQHDFAPEDFRAEAFAIDLATMQATPVASYPAPRQTVQTLALQGTLLAVGGFGHDGDKARSHADAYAYDLTQRTWMPHGSVLPSPRTQFGLAAEQDRLWIFGGLDYDPSRPKDAQFSHPTALLSAKRGEPFAETDLILPRPRRAFGGAVLDAKYFMVGGMAGEFAPVKECDAFSFASSSFATFQCPAAVRISPQLVPLDGKLYLAGGSTSEGAELTPNPVLETYDPARNTWTPLLDTIPVEPRHLTMLPYHHGLLFYSAHRAEDSVTVALIIPPISTGMP